MKRVRKTIPCSIPQSMGHWLDSIPQKVGRVFWGQIAAIAVLLDRIDSSPLVDNLEFRQVCQMDCYIPTRISQLAALILGPLDDTDKQSIARALTIYGKYIWPIVEQELAQISTPEKLPSQAVPEKNKRGVHTQSPEKTGEIAEMEEIKKPMNLERPHNIKKLITNFFD